LCRFGDYCEIGGGDTCEIGLVDLRKRLMRKKRMSDGTYWESCVDFGKRIACDPSVLFSSVFQTARFWDIPRMRRWDGRKDGATLVATFEGGYFMG
jgi:hypothetical protein